MISKLTRRDVGRMVRGQCDCNYCGLARALQAALLVVDALAAEDQELGQWESPVHRAYADFHRDFPGLKEVPK